MSNNGMNSTESLGFKVVTMGREEIDSRRPCNLRPWNLPRVYAWIDSKPIDSRLKEQLKKMASVYPQQALGAWVKNYSRYLAKAQKALKDRLDDSPAPFVELGDEPPTLRESNGKEEIADNNPLPDNDEFDFGWENSGEDQGGQPSVHPHV